MTAPTRDIIAIGNAIVDVLAPCSDQDIERLGLAKGGMALIDTPRAEALYGEMAQAKEISGGSAANTLAGCAALGLNCEFIGQVADDQLGAIFKHDIEAVGIRFATPARASNNTESDPPTARCLIFVTPDGERTMNTFLGASQFLPAAALDEDAIRSAGLLYLEGYLWDPEEPRAAMRRAIEVARDAGRNVAFTPSESFVIDRHGDDFRALIDDGLVDILFCNEGEMATLTGEANFEAGLAQLAPKVPTLVVTRGAHGAVALAKGERAEVAAEPVDKVVDTTGAGDLFAAGFLAGHVAGKPLAECLRMGAITAAEIISHWGPRPEADLRKLVAEKLG